MLLKTIPVGMLATNCYLIIDEATGHAAIVDPGDQPDLLLKAVRDAGAQVDCILLTHGHFDHTGAVKAVRDATGAKVAIMREDADRLTDPTGYSSGVPGICRPAAVTPDTLLKDGDTMKVGPLQFTVLHTPGHSNGSCCYLCGDMLFVGDTLFAGDIGRTDLKGGDMDQMLQSLGRLHKLPGDYRVYPGHGPSTTLDAERAHNPYMRNL